MIFGNDRVLQEVLPKFFLCSSSFNWLTEGQEICVGWKMSESLHENQKPTSYCSCISDTELPKAFQGISRCQWLCSWSSPTPGKCTKGRSSNQLLFSEIWPTSAQLFCMWEGSAGSDFCDMTFRLLFEWCHFSLQSIHWSQPPSVP